MLAGVVVTKECYNCHGLSNRVAPCLYMLPIFSKTNKQKQKKLWKSMFSYNIGNEKTFRFAEIVLLDINRLVKQVSENSELT